MKADIGTSGNSSHVACQVGLGEGREFEIEYQGDDALWATTGPGIESIDMWLKAVIGELDLRIRVIRTQSGIEVSVDRGQQGVPWWPEEDSPRLIVAIDPVRGSISVSARVGHGPDSRRALLGAVSLAQE